MNDVTQPNTVWTPDGETPVNSSGLPGEDTLIEAIATVYDPEIPVNIYELGLIYAVEIDDDGGVKVEMTLTAPGCPVAGELSRSVETAIGAVNGTLGVKVDVVFDPPWDQGRMSDEARVALDMF